MAAQQAAVDSLLALRQAIALEAGLSDPETDGRNTSNLKSALQTTRYDLESKIAFRESQLNQLRAAARSSADFIPMDTPSVNLANQRGRLSEAESELARLRALHPDSSPPVVRKVQQVEVLEASLQEMVADYVRVLEMEVSSLRNQLAVVNQQIADVEEDARQLPYVERRLTLIDTQVDAKSQVLKDFQLKLGEVMLNAKADERVNRLLKVTDPEIEAVVSPLRRYVYMVLVAVAGLVCAILVALLLDRTDNRIYNLAHLNETVDAPVLGAVTLDRK
jgi:uncharacterized protein involved in exopolysaccharide biosynthesis